MQDQHPPASRQPKPHHEKREELTGALIEALDGLLEGARDDLIRFADGITASAADPRTAAEALDQLRLLAEINRLRAVNASWDTITRIVRLGVRLTVAAA